MLFDFQQSLNPCRENNVLVSVDLFTKRTHFIPLSKHSWLHRLLNLSYSMIADAIAMPGSITLFRARYWKVLMWSIFQTQSP